ncbi:hypothetical protein BGZ72_009377 [Mortierella alpina]|nr:hypothetical protein BGZ72_009377 [Mortierella alpina]
MLPITHSHGHDPDKAETPRPVSASSTSSRSSFSNAASAGLNRGLHRRRGSGSSDHSARSPSPGATVSGTGVSSVAAMPHSYSSTFNPEQLRVADKQESSCAISDPSSCSPFSPSSSSSRRSKQHNNRHADSLASLEPDPSAEFEVRVIGNRPSGPHTPTAAPATSLSPLPPTNNGNLRDSATSNPASDRSNARHLDENKSLNVLEDTMPSIQSPVSASTSPAPSSPPATATATATAATPTHAPAKPARLRSLDILRGITIIVMILVNTQGADPFEQLEHSEWFGYTLADWVFPNFIFMVGVAIAIVFSPNKLAALQPQEETSRSLSFWKRHRQRIRWTLKIFKRSVLLFGIGIILSALDMIGRPKEEHWVRIPGVLQRIAFCYLILATTVLWAPPRIETAGPKRIPPVLTLLSPSSAPVSASASSPSPLRARSRSPRKDIASSPTLQRTFLPSRHVLMTLPTTCVVLWFILTYSVRSTATEPIANCDYPPAFVDSDGTVLPGSPPSRGQLSPQWCTAQAFLDTVLFARDRDVNNPVFDSEGSIGNLMAIVSAWFGYVVGTAIMEQQRVQKAVDKKMMDSASSRELESRHPSRELSSDQGAIMKEEHDGNASAMGPKPDAESMKSVAVDSSTSPASRDYADVAVLRTSSIRSGTRASSSPSPSSPSSRPRKPCESQQAPPQQQYHHQQHYYSLQDLLDSQRRQSLLAHLGEWFMLGISVMFAGMALDWVIPICKGLWTPSYTLYSAGISTNALCILMYIYDVPHLPSVASIVPSLSSSPTVRAMSNTHYDDHSKARARALWQRLLQALWRGFEMTGAGFTRLLIFYGRNPTLIYILSEVVKIILEKIPVHDSKYDWIASAWAHIFFYSFITFMPAPWASLVFSTVYILIFAPLMWYLDRKGIYLRV